MIVSKSGRHYVVVAELDVLLDVDAVYWLFDWVAWCIAANPQP